MIKTIKLKPKNGLTVLKPSGEPLSSAGETVARETYWIRRINDGDVEIISESKKGAK